MTKPSARNCIGFVGNSSFVITIKTLSVHDWQTADALAMLDAVRDDASGRKLRLFACALFDGPRWGAVADIVAAGVRQAEGTATRAGVKHFQAKVPNHPRFGVVFLAVCDDIRGRIRPVFSHEFADAILDRENHPHLLREIFGNPFRPVARDPAWLTRDVVALAGVIVALKAYDLMPILGDALQDTGCDSAAVLEHYRGDSPHVKGCWVIDLILGQS